MWVPPRRAPLRSHNWLLQCSELPLTAQLGNFAINLKGGIPYQPWVAELVKNRAKDVGYIDPHTFCMRINYPRAWAYPETRKILQTPTQLVLSHEFNASYRQIFFDGRKVPEDYDPGLERLLRGPVGRRHASRGIDDAPICQHDVIRLGENRSGNEQ
jgi:hypothetical protein